MYSVKKFEMIKLRIKPKKITKKYYQKMCNGLSDYEGLVLYKIIESERPMTLDKLIERMR